MSIIFNPKMRLSKKDKYTIDRLNEYGIKGKLIWKKGGVTKFYLRKDGMISHFGCEIPYKEVDLPVYLEALDKALTERAEQEENAKQCNIILRRMMRLLGLEGEYPVFFLDYLDSLEYFYDIEVTEEICRLRDEYYRLYPKRPINYQDWYELNYPEDFTYWDEYIFNYDYRHDYIDYIPIDEAE